MNYSPLEDRILVKEIKKKELETTHGGIIIPESAKKEVSEGEVVAVGSGRYAGESGVFIPNILTKGDIVLYGSQQGMPLTVDGEELKLMRESDVLLLVGRKESKDAPAS